MVLLDTLRTLRAELAGRWDDIHDGDGGLGDFGEHLLPRLVETGRVGVFDHPDLSIVPHWPDLAASRVRASADVRDSMLSPGCGTNFSC